MKNLETATTEELFTELIKRIKDKKPSAIYFIDNTASDTYRQWSLYRMYIGEYDFIAKEVKE